MRKKIIFYLSLFCFVVMAAQDKDWKSVTPFKDDSDIKKIEISENNIIYALDNLMDRFSISINSGKSWKVSQIDGIRDFSLASNVGGIILFSNKIYKSSNKLFTNSKVIQLPVATASSIYFFNDSMGFIATTNGKILKTINTGDSWIAYNTPSSTEIKSIYFINSMNGYAITDSKQIIGTTDGGVTWTIVKTITNNSNKIIFRNSSNGVVVGSDGIINYTYDGGKTWLVKEVNFSINDIKIVDDKYFGVGYNSEIYSSQNGIDWTINKIENTSINGYVLNSFGFKNSNFYIGTDKTQTKTKIFHSEDLINWSTFAEGVRRIGLQHTVFFNNNDVLALGSSTSYTFQNAAVISKDGGKSWKNVNTGLGLFSTINAFAALPSGKCLIASNNNAFYHSNDFGKSWNQFSVPNIPSGNSIRRIVMFENGDIYLYFWTSIQGPLNLIKYNKTTSWSSPVAVSNLNSTIKSMEFVTSMVGYALTYSNFFSKTTDGGKTWSVVHNFPTQMAQQKITVINENLLYVGNYYSVDGGSTWLPFNQEFDFYTINKDGTGYGAYFDWSIYKTSNYGNSWDVVLDPSSFSYGNGIFGVYSNGDNVIITGSDSDIFILDDNDLVLSSNDIKTKEKQNILVYPNPSNGLLKLKSEKKINSVVVLDMSGKTIIDNKKIQDNCIDISNLNIGIYVFKFIDENGVAGEVKVIKK